MAMTATCLGQMTSQSHMIEALSEVAALERGRILNDHYDIRRYVSRRATFLENRYKNCRIGVFGIARRTAAAVFGSEAQELSVQEIRRRELREEVEPLLPLPTTDNTQTIDDFQAYPAVEWTPGISSQASAGSLRSLREVVDDLSTRNPTNRLKIAGRTFATQTATTAVLSPIITPLQSLKGTISSPKSIPSTQVNSVSNPVVAQGTATSSLEDLPIAPHQHPTLHSQKLHGGLKARNELAEQAANTAMAFNGPQQTGQGDLSDMSSSPFADNSLSSSIVIDPRLTAATSPASMPDNDGSMVSAAAEMQDIANQDFIRKIIDRLGTEKTKQATMFGVEQNQANASDESKDSKKVFVAEGVSALSGRGMSVPVKTAKSLKRQRTETPDPSETTEGDESIEEAPEAVQPPPSKKPKIVKLKVGLPASQAQTAEIKKAKTNENKKNKNKAATTKMAASKASPNHIDSVISGDALPRTKAEAKSAAETRLTRLVEQHNTSMKARKRRSAKPGEEPDFMPEYFNSKMFDKRGEDEPVRCVCGLVDDDGLEMLVCEMCGVWQHPACMGNGVPKDYRNKGTDYFCHVCDPWVHRELVASLRRENVLE